MDELSRRIEEARTHLQVDWDADYVGLLHLKTERRRRRRRVVRATAGVAAAGLLLVGLVSGVDLGHEGEATTVAMGPRTPGGAPEGLGAHDRTLQFEDGSTAQVWGDNSTLVVHEVSPTRTLLELLHGGATFEVTHAPPRSFVVVAGTVRVEVIGTRFSVRWRGARVEVRVEKGRVAVDWPGGDTVLGADEQGLFPPESADTPGASRALVPPPQPGLPTASSPRSAGPISPNGPNGPVAGAEREGRATRRDRGSGPEAQRDRGSGPEARTDRGSGPEARTDRGSGPEARADLGSGPKARADRGSGPEARATGTSRDGAQSGATAPPEARLAERPELTSKGAEGRVVSSEGAEGRATSSEPEATSGAEAVAPSDPVAELLEVADEARRAARPEQALIYLESIWSAHPSDPRSPLAAFTAGRVLVRLGRFAEAAEAFARARHLHPRGALSEDAWAREAESHDRAGHRDESRRVADAYLAAHPGGRHAARLERLR